ncbi:MAG TPA: DUF6526 family protein [Vicinamibacterales bacterium]|nr:DUF6526 family protein [Vicinamibacterales bacterium]
MANIKPSSTRLVVRLRIAKQRFSPCQRVALCKLCVTSMCPQSGYNRQSSRPKETSMPQTQNLQNHTRIVPMFHIGVILPVLINFFWSLYKLTEGITSDALVNVMMATMFILLTLSVRQQILTVQDRVIRLEMRLRLAQILPDDLRREGAMLTVPQLVALRFAGDAELPDLVREVAAGKLSTPKEIKQRVRDWQPDFQRA